MPSIQKSPEVARPPIVHSHPLAVASIPAAKLPEGASGNGGCSICLLFVPDWTISETLKPNVRVASQHLFIKDANGAGFTYSPSSELVGLLNRTREATWLLERDRTIAMPPQAAWLQTTFIDGTSGVDKVEISL